jgi:2-polyprenyl-6-methoxyphenol hydroxylase-like FAD-dependent oxidoreductase
MDQNQYDVIVVGARCAGSPTAMLLARKGYKVLLVDRATFPSDTISTHLVHPPGAAALRRWGLLDRVIDSGCPPIERYAFDVGPFVLSGTPNPEGLPAAYAPRRTVLDALLLEAAAAAGAEVREAFTVERLLIEDGRVTGIAGHGIARPQLTESARVVIGADGLHSVVARDVSPDEYHERAPLEAGYYSYWSGLPMGGFEAYDRGNRGFAAWPTNDGLTVVVLSWPYAEFDTNRRDIERHFFEALDRAPSFAERVRAGTREERFFGTAVRSYFRKPFGPGWALIGDAGYNKDFITAQGITDAFRDAELCAAAVDESLSGARDFDAAMRAYQTTRDEHVLPMYEFTCQFASLTPPPPPMQQLLAAVHGNRDAMDGFVRIFAGVVSPAEFFSDANVARIFGAAGSASGT